MIGVKKLINPDLQLAGDSLGRANLECLENLCLKNPENRFLVTLLSRENQHELCVIARKFNNLLPFGCWWFMNNPSIIDEITRERFELLGWSFIPQHSDARVLDQLLYKWPHSRRLIANVLTDKYRDLLQGGWRVTEEEIQRDVKRLFQDNFETFAPGNS
ncbi:MAG: glucuronate isomerase, partial [Candidatus Hinthialibacter sp.]